MGNDTDQALLERFRRGDASAFGELVVRYQRPLYNAAYWILRNAEDASDVAQIVFLKVAEQADAYDPRYKFFSWIYRIAVNESLNLQRSRHHEQALDDEDEAIEAAGDTPDASLARRELGRRIHAAMLSMNTNDRIVLSLRHFSEYSYQEIAAILEIDDKTVKSRLFEARRRLRDLLADLG